MPDAKQPQTPDGWHSRGYLPHFDGGEIPQFITFRLADSMPEKLLARWREEFSREQNIDVHAALRRRSFRESHQLYRKQSGEARLCKKPEDWRFSSAWFRKRRLE